MMCSEQYCHGLSETLLVLSTNIFLSRHAAFDTAQEYVKLILGS